VLAMNNICESKKEIAETELEEETLNVAGSQKRLPVQNAFAGQEN